MSFLLLQPSQSPNGLLERVEKPSKIIKSPHGHPISLKELVALNLTVEKSDKALLKEKEKEKEKGKQKEKEKEQEKEKEKGSDDDSFEAPEEKEEKEEREATR